MAHHSRLRIVHCQRSNNHIFKNNFRLVVALPIISIQRWHPHQIAATTGFVHMKCDSARFGPDPFPLSPSSSGEIFERRTETWRIRWPPTGTPSNNKITTWHKGSGVSHESLLHLMRVNNKITVWWLDLISWWPACRIGAGQIILFGHNDSWSVLWLCAILSRDSRRSEMIPRYEDRDK